MVVVEVWMWPRGNASERYKLGEARIANDGTGSPELGNYDVELGHSGRHVNRPGVWKRARLVQHSRELSPYHLVMRALQAALVARQQVSLRYRDLFGPRGGSDEPADGGH